MMLRSMMVMASLGFALVLAGACESDSGGASYGDPIQPSATETAAAMQSVDTAKDMRSLAEDDPTNSAAIGSVSQSWGNFNVLVSAKQSASGDGAPTGLGGLGAGLTLDAALTEGCYTTDGTTTTYSDCDTGTGTIDGHIGLQGDTVDIDLTISLSQGTALTMNEQGSLTITDASITGDLHLEVETSLGGIAIPGAGDYTVNYDLDATYNVTLDADGCPVGGTLEIHAISSVSGSNIPGGAGEYDVWVKAEYGPNCGDVTLY